MPARWLLPFAFLVVLGCSTPGAPSATPSSASSPRVEAAFSPEAGAEALVLKFIGSARQSLQLAGYVFTSPQVAKALIEARKRGVDVQVLIDQRENRGKANIAAQNLILNAGIPLRTVSAYTIHHDKYIVIDGRSVQTGSFNYTQGAARSNSENVLVVWDDPQLAASYLAHWQSRWAQGTPVVSTY